MVAVHGAECGFAQMMDPGSIMIEVDPGAADHPVGELYPPAYHAAGLKHIYFTGTTYSSEPCSLWHAGLMLSPICGTYLIPSLLANVLDQIRPHVIL